VVKVKVTKHDHVAQTITFEAADPVVTSVPMPCECQHPDDIKDEMRGYGIHGNITLANVDLSLAEAHQVATLGNRKKCDTCMFTGQDCEIKKDKISGTCLSLFG
jgi:hypothetical protein